MRFIHFATAYVFTANFAFRLYWSFVGNKYARWRNFFPLTGCQIRQIGAVLKVDILQSTDKPVHALGHNSMAYFTYAGTGLLTVFQIISGYALYAPMSNSWFPRLFTWVTPLFGSEFSLRIFHYAVMWAFVVFTIIHVYLVFYHEMRPPTTARAIAMPTMGFFMGDLLVGTVQFFLIMGFWTITLTWRTLKAPYRNAISSTLVWSLFICTGAIWHS